MSALATILSDLYVDSIRAHLPHNDRLKVERVLMDHGARIPKPTTVSHIPCTIKRNRRKKKR